MICDYLTFFDVLSNGVIYLLSSNFHLCPSKLGDFVDEVEEIACLQWNVVPWRDGLVRVTEVDAIVRGSFRS